jgi:1,5-anhydro-D-fructose reductase (1,5-anhydro-D-mannitol-forming)
MGLNIGIIGLGLLGLKRFEIFQSFKEVRSISFFDPVTKTFQATSSANNVDSIYSDKNIDAIVICTPNEPKIDLIEKAFKFKKHIFCEKPLIMSKADKSKLESMHLSNPNIKVKFGFNHRYLSHYRSMKKIIESKDYGKPLWVRGIYGKGFDDSFFKGWRADKTLSGGGILFDQGIHMLDLVIDLFGNLEVKSALIDDLENRPGIEANVFINLRSDNGVPVSIHSSMYQWQHKFSLEVGTEKAIIGLNGLVSSTKSYGSEVSKLVKNWNNNFSDILETKHSNSDFYSFKEECKNFIDSIINNEPIINGTIKDTVRVMDLIEQIYLKRQ